MFPHHDEGFLTEVLSGSLDLSDAIDEILNRGTEKGKQLFYTCYIIGLW